MAYIQLFIHQYTQVLLGRAALNPFIPQPVLVSGVAPTQVQDPTLGPVEPHEVHTGPFLNLLRRGLQVKLRTDVTLSTGLKVHLILQSAIA